MLLSELYKIMVNIVTFVGCRGGGDRLNPSPLDMPLSNSNIAVTKMVVKRKLTLQGTQKCEICHAFARL